MTLELRSCTTAVQRPAVTFGHTSQDGSADIQFLIKSEIVPPQLRTNNQLSASSCFKLELLFISSWLNSSSNCKILSHHVYFPSETFTLFQSFEWYNSLGCANVRLACKPSSQSVAEAEVRQDSASGDRECLQQMSCQWNPSRCRADRWTDSIYNVTPVV